MPQSAVVLVVEDQPIIRMSVLDFVTMAGFEAIGASNADEAIKILETYPEIRLVFTDVEMPGTMDGLKLVHYVRSRWPKVHLLVTSGKMRISERQLPRGAKFFSKPYSDSSIIEAMKWLLG